MLSELCLLASPYRSGEEDVNFLVNCPDPSVIATHLSKYDTARKEFQDCPIV